MPPNPPLDRLQIQLLKTNLQQTNQPLFQILNELIKQLRQFINQNAEAIDNIDITGTGDVVGPGAATDNAIARFDGTTGKLIQNSGITISDVATGSLAGTNTGDVTLAGAFDYVTIAGQLITRNAIDLATDIIGSLPIGNGGTGVATGLTALNATNLTSGTVPDARFPATLPAVSGANLTNLDATDLTTGTVADARLSSNVPLENATNTFTGANSFNTNPLDLLVGQILFPATQNPSSDTNTLDDYEEGTWTPTIGGTGGESGQVYVIQAGIYLKVGRLVFVTFRIQLSTLGTITGTVRIEGLPFASTSTASFRARFPLTWTNTTTAFALILGTMNENVSNIDLVGLTAASTNFGGGLLVQGDLSNTTVLAGSGCYISAA